MNRRNLFGTMLAAPVAMALPMPTLAAAPLTLSTRPMLSMDEELAEITAHMQRMAREAKAFGLDLDLVTRAHIEAHKRLTA